MIFWDARPLKEIYTSPDSRYLCWEELQARPDTKWNKLCCHRYLTNIEAKTTTDDGSKHFWLFARSGAPSERNAWCKNVQALAYRSNEPATFIR